MESLLAQVITLKSVYPEMDTKTCVKCQKTKPIGEFYLHKKRGYYRSACQPCHMDYLRDYRIQNLERLKEQRRNRDKCNREMNPERVAEKERCNYLKHREKKLAWQNEYGRKNREIISLNNRERYLRNPDIKKSASARRRAENPELCKAENVRWRAENRDYLRQYMTTYVNRRLKIDPIFKLKFNLRTNLLRALRYFKRTTGKIVFKSEVTELLIGCSIELLAKHLESLFAPGNLCGSSII